MISIVTLSFMLFIVALNLKKYGGPPKKLPDKLVTVSRVAAVICVIIGITMVFDLVLPKKTVTANINKFANTRTVTAGIYSEEMNPVAFSELKNNETVKLEVSRIYDEIKRITLTSDNNKVINFPTVDDYVFILMTIVFLFPVVLLVKKSYNTVRERYMYYIVTIMSPILGVVGIVLLVKLFLVHGVHVITRM